MRPRAVQGNAPLRNAPQRAARASDVRLARATDAF
jgi:hypothetical protein